MSTQGKERKNAKDGRVGNRESRGRGWKNLASEGTCARGCQMWENSAVRSNYLPYGEKEYVNVKQKTY